MEHNPNKELNSSGGLCGEMCRFVKFNGGISDDQLTWLDNVLQRSDEDHEVVLVAGQQVFYGSLTFMKLRGIKMDYIGCR